MSSRQRFSRARRHGRGRLARPCMEHLENRLVLSAVLFNFREYHAPGTFPSNLKPSPLGILPQNNGSSTPVGYTPQQITTAYNLNNILFGTIQGNGAGQTIAIVDAYDDPSFVNSTASNFLTSDLAMFDQQFGLPNPPSFTKYNENGSTTNLPGTDPAGAGNPNGNWEIEEALDIEWAHAMAPGASIDLVEASSTTNNDLFKAVTTAAGLPGVSVVSMSWGLPEFSGETAIDATFAHPGVTFVAASGDQGSPGYYPAYSPNVVATGGTTLPLDAQGNYPGTGPNGETAWSGSGGGTSQFEPEPAYQKNVQSTGFRTIPDVAWDANPYTGVAVYDSYNNTDGSGPWVAIGGTSVAAPSWSGVFAIINQGRVGSGATALNTGAGDALDPTQTQTALYSLPATDFHDILTGSNGAFSAGPGYDEVTGLGTPNGASLVRDMVAYAASTQLSVSVQPPQNVIAGDGFGIAVSAVDKYGYVDPVYSGSLTLSIAANPGGGSLSGTTQVTAQNGQAVFDGLSIGQIGSGYTLQIASTSFPTTTTSAFNVTTNPTPWAGTFYAGPDDAGVRAAFSAALSSADAMDTVVFSQGTFDLTNQTLGQIVLQNSSTTTAKTLVIQGSGESNTIIQPGVSGWSDRLFEVLGSSGAGLSVVFQNMTLEGGNATTGGTLGGTAALGGALLVDGGSVALSSVGLIDNRATGKAGTAGAAGALGAAGGAGGNGDAAKGGGVYVAAGVLTLSNATFTQNMALGGSGGAGGTGGTGRNKTKASVADSGGSGGAGGQGASAVGGGVYVAGGQIVVAGGTFSQNQAMGGAGGVGGVGGAGGAKKPGGAGGAGGTAAKGEGGAFYVAQGSLSISLASLSDNTATGGAGGQGGSGGLGGGGHAGTSGSIGSIFSGSGFARRRHASPATTGTKATASAHGGAGGPGAAGAAGFGGAIYLASGTLSLTMTTLDGNQAQGGAGGLGGHGGIGGLNSAAGGTLPAGDLGGTGAAGGVGATGAGGGLYIVAGSVTMQASTLSNNTAQGGKGGSGGSGGAGGLAGVFGGGTGTGIGTGSGGAGVIIAHGRNAGSSRSAHPFTTGTPTKTSGGGAGANTGGHAGDGGNGGAGQGGGLYVAGGTITFANDTLAGDSATAGLGGSGGLGGHAGTGNVTGGKGSNGQSGAAQGAGAYLSAGQIKLDNSTVALNNVSAAGAGAGLNVVQATVFLESSIVAQNTSGSGSTAVASDIAGSVVATSDYNVIGTGGAGGLTNGTDKNKVGVSNPGLGSLASNGGPTQTIALATTSPAIAAGSNPEGLLADQRGYSVAPGTTWDAGAYQSKGSASTTAPTATLTAPQVTASNAGSLNPYTFTVTYKGSIAIAAATVPGAVVQVLPAGAAPITAALVSTTTLGAPDAFGDASSIIATYKITPPGGAWSQADNGTYSVTLGGPAVADLSGTTVAPGVLGSFSVQITSNQLVVTTEPPASVVAGANFSLTVTAENNQGAVLTNFTGPITIALQTEPGTTTLGGVLTVSATAGVATFSGLTLDLAGSGYTIAAASSGVASATTGAFNVVAAAASKLEVAAEPPSTVTAGAGFGTTITAFDPYGNVATSFTGTVALAANPSGTTLGGTTSIHAAAGVAAFSGLTLDVAGSGYTLSALSSGLSTATTNSITVQAAAASQLEVSTEPPSTVTAGAGFGLTITALDAYGNVATSFAGSIALAGNPTGTTLGGTTSVAAVAGVAAFSGLTLDIAGTYTVGASSTGVAAATTHSIAVQAAAASQLEVSTEPPSTVTAGTGFGLTITAFDAYGNVATSFAGSIALAGNPTGTTLGGTTSVTAVAGVAAFSGLTLDIAGSYTVGASSTGVAAATTHTITVQAAAASQLEVSTEPPSTVTAGAGFGLTITAFDAYGNVATSFAGSIALAGNPTGTTLGGTTSVTAVAGVAAFSGLTLDIAGTYTVGASSTGVAAATTHSITVQAAAASQLEVSTEPPSTVTAGTGFGLTITALDAYGNVATSFAGSIALAGNPAGTTLGGTTSVTAVAGVAAFSGLTLDIAGTYTVGASSTGVTAATTHTITVQAAAASQLEVSTEPPSTVTAGAGFGLTITALDAYGNVATSFAGSIALAGNPTGTTLGGTTHVTAVAGVAAFSGLTLDIVGAYTLGATSAGLAAATTHTITVVAASTSQLVVTQEPPTTVTAGAGFGLTVTAEDKFGNVETGFTGSVAVALKSNPSGTVLGGVLTKTASKGVAAFTGLIIDVAANGYTIQATGSGLTSALTSAFNVIPAAAKSLVVISQPPGVAVAGDNFGVGVAAIDAYGNLATGFNGLVAVALDANPGGTSLHGTTLVSASGGVAAFSSLSVDVAASGYTILAASNGLTSAVTSSFSVIANSAVQLVVVTQPPASVAVNAPFSIAVASEDAYGNLVTTTRGRVTVGFQSNPGRGQLKGPHGELLRSGVADFTNLKITKPGSGYSLKATSPGLAQVVTNPFDVTALPSRRHGVARHRTAARRPHASLARQDQPTNHPGGVLALFKNRKTAGPFDAMALPRSPRAQLG